MVDLERLSGLRKRRGDSGQVGAHFLLQRGRIRTVSRGNAQLRDLLVRVAEILGRRLDQDRYVEHGQPVHEASIVIGGDHQVRLVCGDRFDVGLEARELCHGGVGRVVRLLIDRDHLVTRVDREEHLSCCR